MVISNYFNSKKNATWSFGDPLLGYVIGHFLHNRWLDFYQIWNTTIFRYPPIPYPPPVVNHQGRILLWITMSHLWFDLIWLGSVGNKSESWLDLFPTDLNHPDSDSWTALDEEAHNSYFPALCWSLSISIIVARFAAGRRMAQCGGNGISIW